MVAPTTTGWTPESPTLEHPLEEAHGGCPRWMASLLEPSAYPDRTQHVELVETHISWVFLTDRHAYKIKKPVKYPFVDFSTLERRQMFCRSEVALNRRLAARVYCGTVPVVRSRRGRYRVEGHGDVVEWAVKMHRLPATMSLEHLLQHRDLDRLELHRLGRMLTDFYNEVPPVPIATTTYRDRIERNILGNRAELLSAVHGLGSASILRTHTAQLGTLRIFEDLLENRVRDGRIVDGHGDLRPEHIYMLQPPIAIDCLEFNRELREIDVVDELAFLGMECDRLGAARIGQEVLRMYAESAHDQVPERLLDFYKSYRASVRAKVFALRSLQLAGRPAIESLAEARDYLRLADRYAEDLLPPLLILVSGISGSGKSTLAERLGVELGIEVLQSDVARQQLVAVGEPQRLDAGRYSAENREIVYQELLRQAAWRLAGGVSVILDATFLKRHWRTEALALATRYRAHPAVVRCECPLDVARQRIARRSDSSSEAWVELPDAQAAQFESSPSDEPRILVDTTACLPVQTRSVYQHLRRVLADYHR